MESGCPGCCLGRLFRLLFTLASFIGAAVLLVLVILFILMTSPKPEPITLPPVTAAETEQAFALALAISSEVLNPVTTQDVVRVRVLNDSQVNAIIQTAARQTPLWLKTFPGGESGAIPEGFGELWGLSFSNVGFFSLTLTIPLPGWLLSRYITLTAEMIPYRQKETVKIRIEHLTLGGKTMPRALCERVEARINADIEKSFEDPKKREFLSVANFRIVNGRLRLNYRPGRIRELIFANSVPQTDQKVGSYVSTDFKNQN